jgi:oligopeptide/dipeptide ABC transporter ATP-binding protein
MNNLSSNNTLLEIKNLKTYFFLSDGVSRAVDGVDIKIFKGKTLGLVGESGCGKSVTALSILRLVPSPPGKIVSGEIMFNNQDLIKLNNEEIRKIRGNKISMIFQEPMTSLNPVFTIGDQIAEVFRLHKGMSKRESLQEAKRMLELVKIPAPEQRIKEYPHQMSGGMRQRVMIAMALSCDPDLLIADEPTTAVDVTVQAQILELMENLKSNFNSSILMITHNLSVIAKIADYVAVMYAGLIMEYADINEIFENPQHPYLISLLKSIPRLDKVTETVEKLKVIEGTVPDPLHYPTGCRFHPRCEFVMDRCKIEEPEMKEIKENHFARCFLRY